MATVVCAAISLNAQQNFSQTKPDNRFVLGVEGGAFLCSVGSICDASVGTYVVYGGMIELGYNYTRDVYGVYDGHMPRVLIYPVTNQMFRIGVGYGPVHSTTDEFEYIEHFDRNSGKKPGSNTNIWESGWYHSFVVSATLRVSENIEFRIRPHFGQFTGTSLTLSWRMSR